MLIKNERLIKLSFINSYSSFLEKISTIYKPDNISIKMNKSITVRLVNISSGKHSVAVWSTVRSFANTDFTLIY